MKKPFKTRPKQITVEPFEYKTTKTPNELYSGGVGPFIVLGTIYGEKGYMIYMNPLDSDFPNSFEPFFRDLKEDLNLKRITRPEIYIIGGETSIKDMYERDILTSRNKLLDRLKEEKLKRFIAKINWCPPNHTQNLRLILSKSRAEIRKFNPKEEAIMNGYDSLDIDDNYPQITDFKTSHRNFSEEDPWETENKYGYHNAQGIFIEPDY